MDLMRISKGPEIFQSYVGWTWHGPVNSRSRIFQGRTNTKHDQLINSHIFRAVCVAFSPHFFQSTSPPWTKKLTASRRLREMTADLSSFPNWGDTNHAQGTQISEERNLLMEVSIPFETSKNHGWFSMKVDTKFQSLKNPKSDVEFCVETWRDDLGGESPGQGSWPSGLCWLYFRKTPFPWISQEIDKMFPSGL